MGPICELKNINLSFGERILFENAHFSLLKDQFIGVIGQNGSGKSCLFNILSKKIFPDSSTPAFEYSITNEFVSFTPFLVPQEPLESSNSTTKDYLWIFYPQLKLLRDQDKFSEFESSGGWDLAQRFESYLSMFGIEQKKIEQKFDSLSGGEKKKVLLALGLSSSSELVLWDEPTNHLDLDTIELFEKNLKDCGGSHMIVSHDRTFLAKVTKRIVYIDQGKINNFSGPYDQYIEFRDSEEASRKALLTKLRNTLRREQDWMNQGIKARGTRSKKRVENFNDLRKKIQTVKDLAKSKLELNASKSKKQSKQYIDLKSLNFSYQGMEQNLFEDVDLSIFRGDRIGVIGANGTGKSTLISILMKKIAPDVGQLKVIDDLSFNYFSQDRDELDPEITPYQLLGEGGETIQFPDGKSLHIYSYFEKFLFDRNQIHRPIKSFSGGEKARLQMAMHLKRGGDIIILDEPTNDLDIETIEVLEKELQAEGITLILISHDRSFLSQVTNKVWFLEGNGKIQEFYGGYEQAESYIQVLAEEKILEKECQQAPASNEKTPTTHTNIKEAKVNLAQVESLIEESEATIEQLSQIIDKLAATNMQDPEIIEKVGKLTQRKEDQEEALMELYEQLESHQQAKR